MAKDPDDMTLEELFAHREDIDQLIADRQKEERKRVLAEVEALGKQIGVKFVPADRGTGKLPKGKPKYRHPDNHNITWTGRGKMSAPFREYLDAHPDLNIEDLRIKESE